MTIRTMPLPEFLGRAVNNYIPGALKAPVSDGDNPVSRYQFYDNQLWDHQSPLVNGRYSAVNPQTIMGSADPQKYLESLLPDGGKAMGMKYDPATGSVTYDQNDEDGFGEWLGVLGKFGGAMLGANGITNWLGGAGGGLGSAGGAMDMGAGGVGEAMGLGDVPWGVNPGGGMDFFNTDSLWGNSGSGGVDNLFGDWNIPNGTFSTTGPASGAFPGYDFGLGYPVGGDLVTNLAGGGSVPTLKSLFGDLAEKVPAVTLQKLLPAALGALGSSAQNSALEDLVRLQGANKDALLAFGAPYRQRLAGLYDNPAAYLNSPEVQIPVQQGTDAVARALSVQGNPIGNGTALQELQNYSANQLFGRLGQEKDRLAGFGGLTQYNNAGANQFGNLQAQTALAQGEGNMWNALGYGLNQVFNPQPTLADLLKEFKGFNPSNSLPA